MPFAGGFLKTTVGRRLFTRFLFAAFIPAILTALIAASYVRSEVRGAIETRVARSARLAGQITLATLERHEQAFRQAIAPTGRQPAQEWTVPPGFQSIVARPLPAGIPGEQGQPGRPLTPDQRKHLESGATLLTIGAGAEPSFFLAAVAPGDDAGRVFWAHIANQALREAILHEYVDEETRLCLVQLPAAATLACDAPVPPAAQRDLGAIRGAGGVGLATWKDGGIQRHAASWDVFLRYAYGAPDWRIIVSQTSETAFGSLRGFTLTFSGILLIALLVVLFLSHAQIRRSTEPLEQLQDGTRRLEQGDFRTAVTVRSQDEFQGLAESFNRMATTLDRQILTLRGLDELHQSVLGALESRPLLETALAKIGALVPDADVLVAIEQSGDAMEAFVRTRGALHLAPRTIGLSRGERVELEGAPGILTLRPGERRPYLGVDPFNSGEQAVRIVPFVNDGRVVGFVAVGTPADRPPGPEELNGIRRLADRVTLAIADIQHVRHLATLSAGTMTAFARAIEANSIWTAGHSERVTALAMVIGERLGLDAETLSTLQRGGILHDIGKIGIPTAVLDKPGKLTAAEREMIQSHPVVGAQILAPIGAFTDVIPIVRFHHEHWDGRGYPDGLSGEEIPHLARILSVADVFDALVSDRPYRAGLSVYQATGFIELGAGSQFDPAAVAAFLEVANRNALPGVPTADPAAQRGMGDVASTSLEDAA